MDNLRISFRPGNGAARNKCRNGEHVKHFSTLNVRIVRHGAAAGLVAALFGSMSGCAQTNYRTEVIPRGEGTVEVERLPLPPAPPRPLVANQQYQAPPPRQLDPDLAQMEKIWPNLSPADRQTIIDLAHRLSGTP